MKSPMSMSQKNHYNFGAGPAMLPPTVLQEAQAELLNWQNLRMSVMEVGHRTPPFCALMEDLEKLARKLLLVPEDYHILFLGSAARLQFAMVPMNLLNPHDQAGYFISGIWSSLAYDEACKLSSAYCVASSESLHFKSLPHFVNPSYRENTRYIYYTPNETINGIRYSQIPNVEDAFLVADMTSCLFTEPFNIGDFGLIFAGTQKNIGLAGLTMVIVRDDILTCAPEAPLATMLDYRVHAKHNSIYATPPTFNCYMSYKMLLWTEAQGGVSALYALNCQKARLLYDYIDSQDFYRNEIEKDSRSIVNVCFNLADEKLENRFLQKAAQQGLYALNGHRLVGGLRASLYNAMPLAGVEALVSFMRHFAKEHG